MFSMLAQFEILEEPLLVHNLLIRHGSCKPMKGFEFSRLLFKLLKQPQFTEAV